MTTAATTNDTRHTPGPWAVGAPYYDKEIVVRSVSDDGWNRLEARVADDDCDHDAAVANARLIAAAPELLAAGELALIELERIERRTGECNGAATALRAALSLARGEG